MMMTREALDKERSDPDLAEESECELFHALFATTGGAVTDELLVMIPVEEAHTGSDPDFELFLFGHWIGSARTRGTTIDLTFVTHSHEVTELVGSPMAPERLAAHLMISLAACPDVAARLCASTVVMLGHRSNAPSAEPITAPLARARATAFGSTLLPRNGLCRIVTWDATLAFHVEVRAAHPTFPQTKNSRGVNRGS